MGFVTGFTGGVTLTLSVAYLSVLAHRRNRDIQSQAVRAQALQLQSIVDPTPQPLPPSRAELAAAERAASVEVLKDHWNEEVSKAVRWVQRTDWEDVREGMEDRLSGLWNSAFGETPAEGAEAAKDAVAGAAQKTKQRAEQKAGSIRESARGAFDQAKSTGRSVEDAARDKVLEARLRTKKEATKVGEDIKGAAEEAKGGFFSWFSSGKEKAAELVNAAKSAVGMGAGVAAIDGQTASASMTPVQKALHQRYDKSQAKDTRTVAEVLQARYIRMDERDNSVLRGV